MNIEGQYFINNQRKRRRGRVKARAVLLSVPAQFITSDNKTFVTKNNEKFIVKG